MYQAFISIHCQGEIVCSFTAYPYGDFGKDSWKRPCLCWTPSLPHTSVMHKWNPAGVWAVWIMFHSNSEVPTFFSLAVELPQGREKGETECVQDSQLHSVKLLKVWSFSFEGLPLVSWLYSSLCDLSSWPTALLQFQLNKLFLIFCLFTFAASC